MYLCIWHNQKMRLSENSAMCWSWSRKDTTGHRPLQDISLLWWKSCNWQSHEWTCSWERDIKQVQLLWEKPFWDKQDLYFNVSEHRQRHRNDPLICPKAVTLTACPEARVHFILEKEKKSIQAFNLEKNMWPKVCGHESAVLLFPHYYFQVF